ncbi:homeodomain-interacting protein kinase 1-like isoform X3 [Sebastes umbrosus]|uniref:homeodomain-interacting protein kinase 1-like isoform X3 n=1 Tax=Sebastes umbrosus TaxID=72105 RepID=UPI00189EDE40|nr:homeodomain-interacting protein kinase 1-like isoform X3 [Sebastes umbrosus]
MATDVKTSNLDNYEMLHVLGEGSYGKVVGCYKRDTKEVVAVKFLKKTRFSQHLDRREMFILEKLRCLDPDECRIIKCFEWNHDKESAYMVFEMLDISLHRFMARRKWAPLPLDGIRTIIKDMATALTALRSVGLIHTDLKMDNIMLVDHKKQPFRVKLIDFGLTLRKSEAWPGQGVQPLLHRSPEVILGHPFSEAIDVWALGTIMAKLYLGCSLFPGVHEYDVLRYITDLLGEVPQQLVKAGRRTKLYYQGRANFFMNTEWTMKTPEQFSKETSQRTEEHRAYQAPSLKELTAMNILQGNKEEEADRSACFDLMDKMLQMDPNKRITPNKILAHPFITGSYVNNGCPQAVEKKSQHPSVEKSNSPKDEEYNSPKDEDARDSKSVSDSTDSGLSSNKDSPFEDLDSVIIPLAPQNSPESFHTPEAIEPKKREKRGIRRFLSTLKRNVFCCFCAPKNGDE